MTDTNLLNIGELVRTDQQNPDLKEQVREAALIYEKKFAAWPNLAYVHLSKCTGPTMLEFGEGKIEVRPSMMILLHDTWIGCKDEGVNA